MTILTIRQYNKIMHDWLAMLTGLNGANVRPQRDRFGFNLLTPDGKPISFESDICMFYFDISGQNIDHSYSSTDNGTETVSILRNINLSVTIIGEHSNELASKLQSVCKSDVSRNYLHKYGIAIYRNPSTLSNDGDYDQKWFKRRSLIFNMNIALEETPNGQNETENNTIEQVPGYIRDGDYVQDFNAEVDNAQNP